MATGNPNHPVTRALEGEWHKLCAIVMQKLGATTVTITSEDIAAVTATNIVADARGNDSIVLRLVGDEEAERLTRRHGGRPF